MPPAALRAGWRALGWWLVGTSRAMLSLARQHAVDRVQFGQRISSFQAIRHRLAETLVAIEGAEATLHVAAQPDDPDGLASLLAKAAAGQAALTTARHCQQVLGGIGFTAEHPLHHHVKRSLILDGLLGSARELTRKPERRCGPRDLRHGWRSCSALALGGLRPSRHVDSSGRLEIRTDMSHPDAPRNEFGVASLILGIVALITCWLLVGVPFGVAAVVTGDIARRRVQRGEANNPRTAIAGIVLGAVAIVAGLAAIGYYAWMSADQMDHYHQCLVNGTYTHC